MNISLQDELVVIENIYRVLGRDFKNFHVDVLRLYRDKGLDDMEFWKQGVISHYIYGTFKKIQDYGIEAETYEHYLLWLFPLEIEKGNYNPMTEQEFKESLINV